MGWRESALRDEAVRRWQRERDQLLAIGHDLDAMRDRLVTSYLIWLDTPQNRLDGSTPRETIRGERSERALLPEPDDSSVDEM